MKKRNSFFLFLVSALFLIPFKLEKGGKSLLSSRVGREKLTHTYSIVARDKESGELGVAVQSHWFSVGAIVSWAEAGVGAVATQSFVEPSYGPLGIYLMKRGKSAPEALKALLEIDSQKEVRQVAMIDSKGRVAVHTGKLCIAEAGHVIGEEFSCQANLMLKDTVPKAMAEAYQRTKGDLIDRLMAALEAAEQEGGDIRGRQSAAILVVSGKPSSQPWKDRIIDLRVEDHPQPLEELKRLIRVHRAYEHMNRGDEFVALGDIEGALREYQAAERLSPENLEMVFWHAVTLASLERVDEALPLFKRVFAADRNWAILLPRLPKSNLLPDKPELIEKILSVAREE